MKLPARLSSIPLLVIALVVVAGTLAAVFFPAVEYIGETSQSITTNFYLIGLMMSLIMLLCIVEAGLVIRIVWGAEAITGIKQRTADDDEAGDLVGVRAMGVTGTKKAAIAVILIFINMLVFDILGGGVLASDTRSYRVLTLLRSDDGQDRADAVHDAILMVGDKRITAALKAVIDKPGSAREWATYAAGVRADTGSADAILKLLKKGNDRERAAAAMALARLKDDRLIPAAQKAYPKMKTVKGDIVKAVGTLGKQPTLMKRDLETVGEFLADVLVNGKLDKEHTRLTVWALGQYESPQGLEPIENLLSSAGDSATLCTGLEALGRIGSASSSPRLLETLYKVDKDARCPELVFADFTGHEVLICSGMNLVERLLREIARIGDRRARPAMEKLAKDEAFSEGIRNMAGEIAFQMKFKRVVPPAE
jgi:HEAT repeat protein